MKKNQMLQKAHNKLFSGWNLGLNNELTMTRTSNHNGEAGKVNDLVGNSATSGTLPFDTTAWNWANESQIGSSQSRQKSKESPKTDDLINTESVVPH